MFLVPSILGTEFVPTNVSVSFIYIDCPGENVTFTVFLSVPGTIDDMLYLDQFFCCDANPGCNV